MQLIRPLLSYATNRGHSVAYVYATAPADEDALIVDSFDSLPEGVEAFPFGTIRPPKASLDTGWLEVTAALIEAHSRAPLDWVIVVYGFPLAPLIMQLRATCGFRVAVLLRGGDAYKWLDPAWLETNGSFGINTSPVHRLYRDALREADFVGAASDWLRNVAVSHGIRVDSVIPSPAVAEAADPTGRRYSKETLCAAVGVDQIAGSLDPEKRWLLVAARASVDKRHDLALRMFTQASLPEWQLVLAAPGPDCTVLGREISRSNPSNTICLVASPPRLVGAFFENCDAYLHSSIPAQNFIDARPSAVTSAAYFGKPVVTALCRTGGVNESLSSYNQLVYGVNLRDQPISIDAAFVSRGVPVLRRLLSDESRARAGEANRLHAAILSAPNIFAKLFDRLEHVTRKSNRTN